MNVDKLKHTPGPWVAQSRAMSDGALVVKDSEFNEICVIRERADRIYGSQNDTDMANSALIEAAPDLLAELEAMVTTWEGPRELAAIRFAQNVIAARAAIAKARGE